MAFRHFVRSLFDRKSGLRRTISKWGKGIDNALVNANKFVKRAGPAISAALPEAAPVIAGAAGALGSYEKIRDAVK